MVRNDVTMTSLPEQWQSSDIREAKQIIYHSKSFDKSYPKPYFTEFEPLYQKLLEFMSHFGPFYRGHSRGVGTGWIFSTSAWPYLVVFYLFLTFSTSTDLVSTSADHFLAVSCPLVLQPS